MQDVIRNGVPGISTEIHFNMLTLSRAEVIQKKCKILVVGENPMKKIKMLILGIIVGLLPGLWFGVNIGREKPLFSNPFRSNSIKNKIRETGESLLQKSGEALESSGKAIKDSLSK